MATHSNILAWRIHGQKSLAGYSAKGHTESGTTGWLSTHEQTPKEVCQPPHMLRARSIRFENMKSQSYGFSSSHVWMWEWDHKEGWVPKNWCFWTMVFERLLRVPWTTGRSNQSILKEINPEYSLEGLIMRLKLQYFGHLMWRANSLEKTLILGKLMVGGEGGNREWDGWMALLTQWTWVWANSWRW